MAYRIAFWGTRGSIPTPGPGTARYGGNTSCVTVEAPHGGDERLVILDAGTGIRPLGRELAERQNGALVADLLLTHTHWDHIQGLPFFAPFFGSGNTIRIWGPKQGEVELRTILRQQMHPVVFPVPIDQVAAELQVDHVEPGAFEIDGFTVAAFRLRHPGTTLAYRLTPRDGGASVAYVPDNELGTGGVYDVAPSWRSDFLRFLSDVDVLIHDAMYTPGELERHRGWGHSSYADAVTLARDAGIRRLVLFHHRPEHDDAAMDLLVRDARAACAGDATERLEVLAASEGMTLTL